MSGGLIVHLGCGDGRLTAALGAGDGLLVLGFDTDANSVATARTHIESLGQYGRISIDMFDGKHLPLIDNLVNLLVADDLDEVSMNEVLRVLCPHGVALIRHGQTWQKTVKPRPEAMDEWTHYLHGADNNAVAHDSLVGAPFHVQWVGGPKWARHHNHLSSTSAMVSAGGRMFTIVDEGPAASLALPPDWKLVARDAFNGVVLWKKPIGPWEGVLRPFRSGPVDLARRMVAVGDRVFVTLGYQEPVVALDAATGEIVRRYSETQDAVEFVCDQGVLYVVAGTIDPGEYSSSQRIGPGQSVAARQTHPGHRCRVGRNHLAESGRRHTRIAASHTGRQRRSSLFPQPPRADLSPRRQRLPGASHVRWISIAMPGRHPPW